MDDSVLIEVGLPIALAIVMVGIGLTTTFQDFKEALKSPKSIIVGLIAQLAIVPLLGFGVAMLLNAPPEIAIGLVLVAATPGGSTSNLITYLARGNVVLGIEVTVISSILVILTLPFWVRRALDVWGAEALATDGPGDDYGLTAAYVSVPFGQVASLLLVVIFIPILIGITIRNRKPAVAAKLERLVSLVSIVVLLGLIIGIIVDLGGEVPRMLASAGPATLLLSFLAVGVGLLAAMAARGDYGDKVALGVELGVKNAPLGILIGLSVLHSEEIALPSAVYALMMYIPAAVMVVVGRRWHAKAEAVKVGANA